MSRPGGSKGGVAVINYSAPEINYLAAALARTGNLRRYVRPYANLSRPWERRLERYAPFRDLYNRTMGRRVLPPSIPVGQVSEIGVPLDFLRAALLRVPGKLPMILGDRLHWRLQIQIAEAGAQYVDDVSAVVASYVVAKSAFEKTSGKRILNYPIAHHRYIQKFIAEEAEREPAFASTLPDWSMVPRWVSPGLDAECDLADMILLGSTFARNSFVAAGVPAEKLVVVPYGADISRFSPHPTTLQRTGRGNRDSHLHVLFVGQIGQRKGISYLLRAYERFHGKYTRLTLVGSFQGSEAAFAPYRQLFHHIPHAPQHVLSKIYRQADVFVFPTLVEGMGLVVLEAMASGLPVITTSNGPGDIVRDGVDGFIVPIRDPDAIVEKLECLRSDPNRRAQMGRNARQRALGYTWREYGERSIQAVLALNDGGGDKI